MAFTVSRRSWLIAAIVVGTAIVSVVIAYGFRRLHPVPPVVVARYTAKAPLIGGDKSDSLWNAAAAQSVKIDKGPAVSFQSLYTKDKIFIRAVYDDSTKDDVSQVWTYRKGTWTNGRVGDMLMLMFNINNSIKGFGEQGSKVIALRSRKTPDISPGGSLQLGWDFFIKADKNDKASIKQRADVWYMSMAVSNQLGLAQDEIFQINPAYNLSPYALPTLIELYPDKTTTDWPININVEDIHKLAGGRPRYKYLGAETTATLPYPKSADMAPITDYSGNKDGDKLPFIIFTGGTWNDSAGDVEGHARWEDGRWTVEMGRKLDTRHSDDIVFKPNPSETVRYYFSPLVRTDGQRVRQGPSVILEFEPVTH